MKILDECDAMLV